MYTEFLIQAGLTTEQAALYQSLIKNGPSVASKMSSKTGIKRSLVYKILSQLETLGLVKKQEKDGSITRFSPIHPSHLKELLEKREKEIQTAKSALGGVLGSLTSDFNLFSGKPNVQFYEGLEGVKNVLDDSLYAKEEIFTFVDLESVETYISDINKKYSEHREKLGIKKRGIVLDTPFNRNFLKDYRTAVTDTKLIELKTPPFHTVMQIYDGKISYITLRNEQMIGVIIEDAHIASMHRMLFEYLWNITPAMELGA